MKTIYDISVDNEAVDQLLLKIQSHIFQLLPLREEGVDWQKPLETVIVETLGLQNLLKEKDDILLSLVCKLQGMLTLTGEENFMVFRRTVFECCGLINKLRDKG